MHTKHQNDHTYKSLKLPASRNPKNVAIPKRTIKAMLPLLPPFLTQIETIPPTNSMIDTIAPALPLTSPLLDIALPNPAAHDWKETMINKIMEMIPETNFHVVIGISVFALLVGVGVDDAI